DVLANLLAHEALVELDSLLLRKLLLDAGQALLANLFVNADPVEAAAGLRLSGCLRHEVARQSFHRLAAWRMLADHPLGKLASLVIGRLRFREFGNFDFVVAGAI